MILSSPLMQVNTEDGDPAAFAKASFTETGTTTPVETYQDGLFTTPHTDPVVADEFGQFPPIYLDPGLGQVRLRVIEAAGDLSDPPIDIDPANSMFGLGEVTNQFLADMPPGTVKSNLTAGTAPPDDNTTEDLTDALRYTSETEQGVVELATVVEATAGVDTQRAVTPAGLQAFFDAALATDAELLASPGYVTFTNGLILQWGKTALVDIDDFVDVVFPLEFPTACFAVLHSPSITDAYTLRYDSWSLGQGVPTVTGFKAYCASSANAHGIYITWFAIGH